MMWVPALSSTGNSRASDRNRNCFTCNRKTLNDNLVYKHELCFSQISFQFHMDIVHAQFQDQHSGLCDMLLNQQSIMLVPMFKFTYMPRSIEASDSHKLSYFALLTLIKVGVLAKSGQESMNFLRSRSRYSKTRYMRFSLWITSCNLHAAIKASQHRQHCKPSDHECDGITSLDKRDHRSHR